MILPYRATVITTFPKNYVTSKGVVSTNVLISTAFGSNKYSLQTINHFEGMWLWEKDTRFYPPKCYVEKRYCQKCFSFSVISQKRYNPLKLKKCQVSFIVFLNYVYMMIKATELFQKTRIVMYCR